MITLVKVFSSFTVFCMSFLGCQNKTTTLNTGLLARFDSVKQNITETKTTKVQNKTDIITLGAGCFWCVEAVFQQLNGVVKVESGYSNGALANPTYKEVCSGLTGHAEVCQVTYNPSIVSFEEILEVFWKTHDPTTLNRQGADVGSQYRSGVYYHTAAQAKIAQTWKDKLNAEAVFPNPIVTEIVPVGTFYKAENYHQNYFNENGYEPYCQIVIKPKLEKFEKVFKDKMKKK
jgi:peptide-methionine (S)-S-oxide reductase